MLLTVHSTEYHFAHVTVFLLMLQKYVFYQFQDVYQCQAPGSYTKNVWFCLLKPQIFSLVNGHYTYNKLEKKAIASRLQFNTNLADLAKVACSKLYNVPHSAKTTLKAIRAGTIGEKLPFSYICCMKVFICLKQSFNFLTL